MHRKSFGFIGGGRITRILLQAFENKNYRLNSVHVYDSNPQIISHLKKLHPYIVPVDTVAKAAWKEVVFIALHPPVIKETLESIRTDLSSDALIISLAPKISIEIMGGLLGKTHNIARLIPNATSFINEGYNPISFSDSFPKSQKQDLLKLLSLLGHTFEVSENKLEGYAILSAMLPTYFWFQWKSLQEIGLKIGLNEMEAIDSIQNTTQSAMKLLFEAGLPHDQVIDLIPVKPIGEHEDLIKECFNHKLLQLYDKIKP